MMEPLRIRWSLARPMMLPDRPIHLDALLAWARVEEDRERGLNFWEGQDDLPLEKFETSSGWVWKASWLAILPAGRLFHVSMVRRTDEEAFALDQRDGIWASNRRRMAYVNVASGQCKAYAFSTTAQWVDQVEAHCVGDRDRVQQLLSRVEALGRLTRNGYGRVARLEVEPGAAPNAWCWRSMPADAELGEGWARSVGTLVPPYWQSKNRVDILEPLTLGPGL